MMPGSPAVAARRAAIEAARPHADALVREVIDATTDVWHALTGDLYESPDVNRAMVFYADAAVARNELADLNRIGVFPTNASLYHAALDGMRTADRAITDALNAIGA